MKMQLFANTENDVTVKEFSYSHPHREVSYYGCIIRRETPETETGITWEVFKQVGTNTPTQYCTERYAAAEMDFKNFVLEALNTDHFYKYSAEK
jgi:hypothetical protein